jgi:hypothetical protein
MQLKTALESKDVVIVEVESLTFLDRGVDTASQWSRHRQGNSRAQLIDLANLICWQTQCITLQLIARCLR